MPRALRLPALVFVWLLTLLLAYGRPEWYGSRHTLNAGLVLDLTPPASLARLCMGLEVRPALALFGPSADC